MTQKKPVARSEAKVSEEGKLKHAFITWKGASKKKKLAFPGLGTKKDHGYKVVFEDIPWK